MNNIKLTKEEIKLLEKPFHEWSQEYKLDKKMVLNLFFFNTDPSKFNLDFDNAKDKHQYTFIIENNMSYLSAELKNDKDFMLSLIEKRPYTFKYIGKNLKNDAEINLLALIKDINNTNFIDKKIKNQIGSIEPIKYFLNQIPDGIYNKKSIIDNFIDTWDDDIINYIHKNPSNFLNIPTILQNNRQFLSDLLKKNGKVLEYVSKEFKNDKKIALEAVSNLGINLAFLTENFKNDKEIVIAAVIKNGLALEYTSKELKNDKEVIWQALKNNIDSFQYTSEEFQEEVGLQNPLEYLENYFFHQQLEVKISTKETTKVKKKI